MVRAGVIIAKRFGRIFAQEYRAGVVQPADIAHRFLAHHLEVFRREAIGKRHRFIHIPADNDRAVIGQRAADNFSPRLSSHLPFQLRQRAFGNRCIVGQQDGRGQPVMLCL